MTLSAIWASLRVIWNISRARRDWDVGGYFSLKGLQYHLLKLVDLISSEQLVCVMRELLRLEADASMELHFKPLSTFRLDPLTVYALVLLFRPGILKLMQFKALAFKAFDLCPYTLSIVNLTVLKGIAKHVR